ncbi:bis(5'-nucleosyl)-tetraphosphatase PrpE [Fictibacillus iocasae]|uniref:Bis(5'-nucleosyl)-tetraphosphatase PrpE n=1 Tax=Fictibacillus iocasae TaxID=2715437 RepID=A0ABW2NRH9_9BACL
MKIDVIGDIHGCYIEFEQLTKKLGYTWDTGLPVHPEGRMLAFVGDLTDRGPQSLKVIETVCQLISNNLGFYTPGNHCNKLYRYFLGRKVQITHGLETTVAELENTRAATRNKIKTLFISLYENAPLYLSLDDNRLIVAHAGIKQGFIGRSDKQVKTFVLYGDITGEKHPNGMPVRRDWAMSYEGEHIIVYGHTPVQKVRHVNNTWNIDTGCVFGGKLSAFRYPEKEVVSVVSSMPYQEEKFHEFS